MRVLALVPRGYCHGVVHAMTSLKALLKDKTVPRPIHILGMLVHNQHIVKDFEALGAVTVSDSGKTRLELLDQIHEGTVVITAHGASQSVLSKAKQKNLHLIDLTCHDVKASQQTVLEHLNQGYHVVFIGKKTHPESETVLAFNKHVSVISDFEEIETLEPLREKIALTNQTTMSLFDVYSLSEAVKKKFPQTKIIEEICDATKKRQLALMYQPDEIQHCFVIGDPHSHNSQKLVEVSSKHGIESSLIPSFDALDIEYLKTLDYVSVTSGASTPSELTRKIIHYLKQFDKNNPDTY